MPRDSRPTPEVKLAWSAFLIAHRQILRRLDADLEAAHGISLEWYDLLFQLAARDGASTMGELSSALLIGHSRCSRRVDRLEAEGLVERRRDDEDHRIIHAALTPAGRALQKRAAATHLRGIQGYFGQFLTEADAARMSEVLTAGSDAAAGAPSLFAEPAG